MSFLPNSHLTNTAVTTIFRGLGRCVIKYRPRPMRRARETATDGLSRGGGIKDGFAGFVPGAQFHYGSSQCVTSQSKLATAHALPRAVLLRAPAFETRLISYGGLPFHDKRRPPQHEMNARRRNRAQPGLNVTSSADVGRQAWNVEWADTKQMLKILRPQDLEKYKIGAAKATGMRGVESGLNALEAASGIDIDGDGDVGLPNGTRTGGGSDRGRLAHARAHSERAAPRAQQRPQTGLSETATAQLPSYRRMAFVTSSRDHATPDYELHRARTGGIVPRYMGFVPKAQFQFGVTTVGGIHADATGSAEDYKLHFGQSNEAWHQTGAGKSANNSAAIAGYTGHQPNAVDHLGASLHSRRRGVTPEPTATEYQRLDEAAACTWRAHDGHGGGGGAGVPGYTGHVARARDTIGRHNVINRSTLAPGIADSAYSA